MRRKLQVMDTTSTSAQIFDNSKDCDEYVVDKSITFRTEGRAPTPISSMSK